MSRYCRILLVALAITLASAAAADQETIRPRPTPPPVLKRSEPADNVFVTLPGPRVRPAPRPEPPPQTSQPAPASPAEAPQPSDPLPGPVASAVPKPLPTGVEDPRPILHRPPRPVFPADFERDSAAFCQKRIGQWTKEDAYNLLGDPLRDRPAFSDSKSENGRIYAFSDPTGRYKSLELDFAAGSGALRTVYVYPWSLTWVECQRRWGGKVTSTEANNGRIFYSYVDRRLDVLVESGGKVVSLGLY